MSNWVCHTSEEFFRQYAPGENEVCICITDPWRDPESLYVPSLGYVAVLRESFHDIATPNYQYELMTWEQAKNIAEFILQYRGKNFMVHCAAGISRSGAIAEAILEAFPEYEDAGNPALRHANPHVKTWLKRALGVGPIGANLDPEA